MNAQSTTCFEEDNELAPITENTQPSDTYEAPPLLPGQSIEPAQEYLNSLISRINKTHSLFAKINNSIKK